MIVGLFFGSFNPIHNGHLAIAEYILNHSQIDQLWFVVSPQNPFKKQESLLDNQLRYEMVKLAISGHSTIEACDVEFGLPKPSYTINTLEHLREIYPNNEFRLIMGSDNYLLIDKWKDYQKIISEYTLIIYPRPGFDPASIAIKGNFQLVYAPQMEISSTSIREAISQNRDISKMVPNAVSTYIAQHNLYRNVE